MHSRPSSPVIAPRRRVWRVAAVLLGVLWSTVLLTAGWCLAGWPEAVLPPIEVRPGLNLAGIPTVRWGVTVLAMAGGSFTFLVLVADVLCPRTPMVLRTGLQVACGAAAWLALLVMLYGVGRL